MLYPLWDWLINATFKIEKYGINVKLLNILTIANFIYVFHLIIRKASLLAELWIKPTLCWLRSVRLRLMYLIKNALASVYSLKKVVSNSFNVMPEIASTLSWTPCWTQLEKVLLWTDTPNTRNCSKFWCYYIP